MSHRLILCALYGGGLIFAGLSAGALARIHAPAPSHACVAIGAGVCLSGTTEWVAQAAAQMQAGHAIDTVIVADAN